MTAEQQRIINAARSDDRRLSAHYSGRGMNGRTCMGISCHDPEDVIAEVGVKGARTDSLGKATIVYWPDVPSPERA